MAERKTAKKGTQKSVTSVGVMGKAAKFSDEELSAMKARVRELKAGADDADGEREVLAKIAEMQASDRALGKRLHGIIKSAAPALSPKLWYGMPAYAKNGKMICHFISAQKFKTRYATLGFSDQAKLDEGAMWPVAYALKELTAAEEVRITALVKKAVA
jgi:uncharacterized protein YdhG (YjbR/CyaY superfamily)